MCIIIDANIAPIVFREPYNNEDLKPILNWCEQKDGCIVIGGKLSQEILNCNHTREFIQKYARLGLIHQAEKKKIEEVERIIKKKKVESNDIHVLALAIVSSARILFTEDKKLQEDFKNPKLINNPKGKIYKNKKHKKLLKHNSKCKKNRN